jgi:hypothetical protein
VDSRRTPAPLTIFRRGADEYEAAPKSSGWARSEVFGLSFRLRLQKTKQGMPKYLLDSRKL